LGEFVYALGKGILTALKPKGRKVWEFFLNTLQSLKSTISFDINGNPEWSVGIGDIQSPDITLDEIFAYLEQADKPCLVAIDEFQTIPTYLAFANHHLAKNHKEISAEAFACLYHRFDGITWYVQYVLNMLYTSISDSSLLTEEDVNLAIDGILAQQRFAYQALIYQLTAKQKQVLTAIAREGKPSSLMSQEFLQKYHLGASTVQGAVKTLLDKDFITQDEGVYQLCDKFLELSLRD